MNLPCRLLSVFSVPLLVLGASSLVAQDPPVDKSTFHLSSPTGLDPHEDVIVVCPHEKRALTHWDLRQFSGCGVPFEVNGAIAGPGGQVPGPGQPNPDAATREVLKAAATWTSATPAHVSLVYRASPSADPCPKGPRQDQRNCVSWDRAFDFGDLDAITCVWLDATTGRHLEADIIFNEASPWTDTADETTPGIGIQALALHEFGHFLGLAHTDDPEHLSADCAVDIEGDVQPIMQRWLDSNTSIKLRRGDLDGVNFLYSWDLGDHRDVLGRYPTNAVGTQDGSGSLNGVPLKEPLSGAGHFFGIFGATGPRYQYEWLGFSQGKIDDHASECAPRRPDAFDDGVKIWGKCKADGTLDRCLAVIAGVRTAADLRGKKHPYGPVDPANPLSPSSFMYINGFFDWNDDGDFEDPGEHAIGGPTIPGVAVTEPRAYGWCVEPPANTKCAVKSRFRLDYEEDVGEVAGIEPGLDRSKGLAQFGEIEDYVGHRITPPDAKNVTVPGVDCPCEGEGEPPIYCHLGAIGVVVGGSDMEISKICHPPEPDWGRPIAKAFPLGAVDCMDSTLTFDIDHNKDGKVDESLGLTGPVCVDRSDPYIDPDTGLKVIDTKMVSLDMRGYSQFVGRISIQLSPNRETSGRIQQTEEAAAAGVDLSLDHPAHSYFDVYFTVRIDELGTSETVGPARVETMTTSVPPGRVLDAPVSPAPAEP